MFTQDYFVHRSYGKVFVTPDRWLFLAIDPGIIQYYHWFAIRYGLDILRGSKSGPHISIVKGNLPNMKPFKNMIGKLIDFRYSNQIRYNENHVWIDVTPAPFNAIRAELGLKPMPSFHFTIGRFKHIV